MTDSEQFSRSLDQLEPAGAAVTEEDLEEDAASFVAFAGALGIKPPGAA